jgi:2-polyprenyl-6-hydroxyphenyl methylase / 3-demethylubiquinone-9 3-methyltransferase
MNENYDPQELAKFASLAAHWWDPTGELKTLHQINPLRLRYISEKVDLTDKTVIDIGCGGGILAESMASQGATVTGIDLNKPVIDVAKLHQLESGTQVEYLTISAESIAASRPGYYDVVTCLEMLEHVPDPLSIIQACAKLIKPGGHLFFSTLNRNPKSYLFAIIGAEYILKLLPKNTHDYAKFIRPSELCAWGRQCGLVPQEMKGITYRPFTQVFKLTDDISVNYLFYAISPI